MAMSSSVESVLVEAPWFRFRLAMRSWWPMRQRPLSASAFAESVQRNPAVEICWNAIKVFERLHRRTGENGAYTTALLIHRAVTVVRSMLDDKGHTRLDTDEARCLSLGLYMVVTRMWMADGPLCDALRQMMAPQQPASAEREYKALAAELLVRGRTSLSFQEAVCYLALCGAILPGWLVVTTAADGEVCIGGPLMWGLLRRRRQGAMVEGLRQWVRQLGH